jgi:membrane protease YdiL (CAAX protease family)
MLTRNPLIGFFGLAFLLTWAVQIPVIFLAYHAGIDLDNQANFNILADIFRGDASRDEVFVLTLFNLGQLGPLTAALVMTGRLYGRPGVRDLIGRMLRWRLPARWYLIVLGLPFLLSAVALLVALITDGLSVGPFEPDVSWTRFVPFFLYMTIFTGLAEEPGWRGFALPHLQTYRTAYQASWVLGVLWGAWHIPFTVYYNREEPFLLIPAMAGLVFGTVGWTIVLTWLYNSTRSVWLLILLHGWNNTIQSYFILSQDNDLAQVVYSLAPWAIAAYLARRCGEEHLAEVPRPTWWPGRGAGEQRKTAV